MRIKHDGQLTSGSYLQLVKFVGEFLRPTIFLVFNRLFRRHFFLAQQSIMSGGIEALQLKEEDVVKLLAAGVHLGASNVDFQMESYVYKRKPDGNKSAR